HRRAQSLHAAQAAAAGAAADAAGLAEMSETPGTRVAPPQPLLPWTLSFLRPYRGRVAVIVLLLLAQVGLNALQPWPLKIVIDYVLQGLPLPEPFATWLAGVQSGDRFGLLVSVVVA